MGKKLTKEEFIDRAKSIYGDKYDYSKVDYIDTKTKVCIICPKHGEFWQTPNTHLQGSGCRKCWYESYSRNKHYTKEIFINKCKKKYGDKYDYSKVEYINSTTKVCLICPEHGEFWQKPVLFLRGHGCQKCGINRRNINKKLSTDGFIKRAKKIHGDKYDYSNVEYVNANAKVCIICPEHGEFWQKPAMHLLGQGCKKCYGNDKMTLEDFINKANVVHNNKYDYSKVEYTGNNKTKVCIICPEHGEFWQRVDTHLRGNGCHKCNTSKLELGVEKLLNERGIKYIHQAKKEDFGWLGRLTLDFYLPEYNVAIECQGIQHFKEDKNKLSFFTEKNVNEIIERDKRKNKLCADNGVNLLYYSELCINFPYKVITDKNNLIKEIYNYGKTKS